MTTEIDALVACDQTRSVGRSICKCTADSRQEPTSLQLKAQQLSERFRRASDLTAASESIEIYEYILQNTTEKRYHPLCYLAYLLHDRYRYTGDVVDLENAVKLGREAVEACNVENVVCAAVLIFCGDILDSDAEVSGNDVNRRTAEEMFQEAVVLCPIDHRLRPIAMRCLSFTHFRRFDSNDSLHYVDEAIATQRSAIALLPLHCADRHRYLSYLGMYLRKRYDILGTSDDLEEAIGLLREATEACPPTHVDRESILVRLGHVLFRRFELAGRLQDLEDALDMTKLALTSGLPASQQRVYILSNLCNMLQYLIDYRDTSVSYSTLTELVRLRQEALMICPRGFHGLFLLLDGLASAFWMRFIWSGEARDLEEAIGFRREALKELPPNSPQRWVMLVCMGSDLCSRFKELGQMDDLNEAVQLHRIAVANQPSTDFQHLAAVTSLLSALCIRFRVLRSPEDLEEGIRIGEEHLQSIPTGHRWRAEITQELSNALLLRGEHYGTLADIDRAIELLHSVNIFAPGSLAAPQHARVIGLAYMAKFHLTHDTEYAARAKTIMTDLLQGASSSQRDCFQYLLDLSEFYLQMGTQYFNPYTALEHLALGVADGNRDVRSRIQGAAHILEKVESMQRSENTSLQNPRVSSQLLDIYSALVSLLPRVAYFGVDPLARLHSLTIGQNIATIAATKAISLSQLERAVEILEQGRAIFWTHVLRLRSQFDHVPIELRERLVTLAQNLDRNLDVPPDAGDKHLIEKALLQRRLHSDEFDVLLEQVRQRPGLERFMLYDEFSTLARAAARGPIVILVASANTCNALIITAAGGLKNVPLRALDEAWIVDAGRRWKHVTAEARSAMRTRLKLKKVGKAYETVPRMEIPDASDVLEGLWSKIVEPVLSVLGFKPSIGRARPRIWWCPTGNLVHFPIHAACSRGKFCSDYVVSSYTPTISSLLHIRQEYTTFPLNNCHVLLAAVPQPFSEAWGELPHTLQEIQAVQSVIPQATLLGDGDRSRHVSSAKSVLKSLPNTSILHLACHGLQEADNPLKSGFVMSDQMITIEQLMDLPLPRAFLAFLSACETAKGDRNQPDQTVNLAATMLFAGFKSVIATLWSMEDVDGPHIATHVYRELFGANKIYLEPDDVPYALDAAVQELRRIHPDPSRWAPYIHLGM